jgi:prepilin-type N-terminal cleavage/methylation domain-containing protein/prepilin-type processing-associated H-X9-DG protein
MRTSPSKGCKGFTLVELLVVISIIAMLLAILLPSLQKARASAQSTVCRSQLKQFGIAILTYAQDNVDSFLMHEYPASGVSPESYYWFGRIAPYINVKTKSDMTTELMRCPSGISKKQYGKTEAFAWAGTDYGLQLCAADYTVPNDKYKPMKIYNIKQPAKFSSFFDFYYGEGVGANQKLVTDGAIWSSKWAYVVENSRALELRAKVLRHNKGINVLYIDSHVLSVRDPKWWLNLTSPSSFGWESRPTN